LADCRTSAVSLERKNRLLSRGNELILVGSRDRTEISAKVTGSGGASMAAVFRKIAVLLGTFLGAVVICLFVAALIRDRNLVYATPERESAFLKNYTLDATIKPFVSPRWISSIGSGDSAGAGNRAAHYDKEFEARFAMRSDDRQALMTALAQNIATEIGKSGGRIIAESGDTSEGFRFEYAEGRSKGTILLSPVQRLDPDHLGGAHGRGPRKESLRTLCPDEIPVGFTVSAKETWSESEQ
jgi:hypothetical protein